MIDRETVLRMAEEAGFHPIEHGIVEGNLLRFAAAIERLAREQERSAIFGEIAHAVIRARGTK